MIIITDVDGSWGEGGIRRKIIPVCTIDDCGTRRGWNYIAIMNHN